VFWLLSGFLYGSFDHFNVEGELHLHLIVDGLEFYSGSEVISLFEGAPSRIPAMFSTYKNQ